MRVNLNPRMGKNFERQMHPGIKINKVSVESDGEVEDPVDELPKRTLPPHFHD